MQANLFGRQPPGIDLAGRGGHRTALCGGAWVEHETGFLEGHESVFQLLERACQWRQQRRRMYEREVEVPRLVAAPPEGGPAAQLIARLGTVLSKRYGRALPQAALAYYRDGRDGVAFHGDRIGRRCDDALVAIVSVGSPRRFLLRPAAGGRSLAFDLGWGDLLVMGGTCQRTWMHSVPKRAHAHPRISVVFRSDASE